MASPYAFTFATVEEAEGKGSRFGIYVGCIAYILAGLGAWYECESVTDTTSTWTPKLL